MNPQNQPAPDQNVRQQVVTKVKAAKNVLLTVSANPTVDQLAAIIGFTLVLNKLGKHASAVYSGATPSTIEFLEPEKTIEKTTDSLRDFIIALDKAKADKLRYKVEDNFVKIFITPYKTSLTEKDLEFSQGDFNVDLVLALGVKQQQDFDQAIMAHGNILHDALIISVNNQQGGDLGALNWNDAKASSLSEMLAGVSTDLNTNALDGQIATAFLTGIVAETERFSNDKTTPQTMTVAGTLMHAGANQQLVATKLETPPPVPEPLPLPPLPTAPPSEPESTPSASPEPSPPPEVPTSPPATPNVPLPSPARRPQPPKPPEKPAESQQLPLNKDGSLDIHHQIDELSQMNEEDTRPDQIKIDQVGKLHNLQDGQDVTPEEDIEAPKPVPELDFNKDKTLAAPTTPKPEPSKPEPPKPVESLNLPPLNDVAPSTPAGADKPPTVVGHDEGIVGLTLDASKPINGSVSSISQAERGDTTQAAPKQSDNSQSSGKTPPPGPPPIIPLSSSRLPDALKVENHDSAAV